ncbi:MAG: M20/M25/M40 family metallo-hydrolase [Planctomycetaceae bacterium]|nr:M20/M25/M40 family metallo-hydrolase [Planctomycetaceae bacterium]
MSNRFKLLVPTLLLAIVVAVVPYGSLSAAEKAENASLSTAVNSIEANDLKKSVSFLASDALEGREAGSEGSRAAAVFIIEKMEQAGLQPLGSQESFEQHFGKNYRNLLGFLPGSDPELADEVVVIGAHYDHVGYGYSGNSRGTVGQIHNGADDNGSGVGAILEIIEAVTLLETPPRRPILFAFWDAEELGLLGSKHWTANPTINLQKVRFYINLDMIGRLKDNHLEVYGVRTADGLRRLYAITNHDGIEAEFNWYLRPDSDHYSFLKQNIPFLMPFTKKHPDYHRASDDFDKVNYEGHQKVTRQWFQILMQLANADHLPRFRNRSRAENEAVRRNVESRELPRTSRLGISWNTEQSEAAGELIVRGVAPNSAAAIAGIRTGDRIVAWNGRPFETSASFIQDIFASQTDSVATIRRGDEETPEPIPVQLQGEPVLIGLSFRSDDAESRSLVIAQVVSDSPASQAGLQKNDRILSIEGEPIHSSEQATETLFSQSSPVRVQYEHHGLLKTTTLEPLPILSPPKAEQTESTANSE